MKESLRRISIGVAVGAALLFVGMFAFTKPAHAHGGGDVGRAFVGVLGAATAIAIIDTVAYRRGYAPGYVVVQPQPVYVARPPRCYVTQRPMTDQNGNPLYVDVNGQLRPATRQVQVCEYD